LIFAAALSSCGGGSVSSVTAPISPSPPPAAGLACGVERWFVKTLSDQDAGSVNVNAITPISIRELNGFDTHCSGLPERRAFGEEFKVFEVTGRITFVAHEDDRDYHVALEDPNAPGFSVVAELADILCAGAVMSPHFSSLSAADARWQRGRSQNCIELHPILSILSP
jgi:hypothetical protein